MVTVDKDKCQGCGMCVKVCHNRCLALIDDVVSVDYELCDRCTQCIAICPQQALSWSRVPPVGYDENRLPSPEQLEELFKERRSIRFFREDKIDQNLIEEIVRYGIYAPTNNHDLRAAIVNDVEVIEELERITVRFNSRMYRLFFKPKIVFAFLRRITPAVNAQVKAKLEGRRHDLFNPAAMVFIIGE